MELKEMYEISVLRTDTHLINIRKAYKNVNQ